ncbi:hypothetical protein A4D02_14345 [Niastella koreensis]|uniref:Uncharacterized protein n=2 Tax=Niastella koreensis TaxID=354356 RepID=G8T9C6_NIAKG|nr:hypothetical protein [Niastella koreensis]AEV98094.1 hypothetical protein Niako_1731 [Niastella koreensis GR20-10]OQP40109.1 hypothetical protein A4D02_14345 [Niastella koreensis]
MKTPDIIFFVLLSATIVMFLIAARNKQHFSSTIIAYLVLVLATSVLAVYLRKIGVRNNLFLFHIYTPIAYTILSLLYLNAITSALLKKIITASIPFFILLSIVFSAFVQKPHESNSYSNVVMSLLILTWSLFYLREVLLLQRVTHLQRFPMFWICVGILFCFTGNLFTVGMLNYLIKYSMEMARQAYGLTYIFKYLALILLMIGAWCQLAFKE